MTAALAPLAWATRPSLIEVVFPAQKISIEAQCERKANAGQTLTALGSYWKGRKPLVLVRACVLASLLPSTGDTERDLEVFEALMAIDDKSFVQRVKKVSCDDVIRWGGALREQLLDDDGNWKVRGDERRALLGRVLAQMPYDERLDRRSLRPEELPAKAYEAIWGGVNTHLGTNARSHEELVEQLGILRFGHRPKVADTFSGGGSIPFEAARLGCDVYASDLNPIACMLTWGAFNIVGADADTRTAIAHAQRAVAQAVDHEITNLGIEHDENGNRAKAFLYCVEVRCPETGWVIPLAPTWVISLTKRCVARLVPNKKQKRFDIAIASGVSDQELEAAKVGTIRESTMVYVLDGHEHRTPIKTLRGDRRSEGETVNNLRRWEARDVVPRPDDLFQERLFCVQWMKKDNSNDTFLCGATARDIAVERQILDIVTANLLTWQADGLVPDMAIMPGDKTDEPIRTRGWTYWHHLFVPRSLLYNALYRQRCQAITDEIIQGVLAFKVNSLADCSARLSRWEIGSPRANAGGGPPGDAVKRVFYNMALNTLYVYGARSFRHLDDSLSADDYAASPLSRNVRGHIEARPAIKLEEHCDLFITDPPYADAIRYEEITEFFIAWLRKRPPAPFRSWVWDSRRDLAIHGSGESFRLEMAKAYQVLAEHMRESGLQIVMFTHQDAKVWGDMAGIFWGAGLRVTAAWYVATETTSELKKGGYVQGTVILVLRKRTAARKAYKDELVLEIRDEVARQIDTMVGLNQGTRAHGRSENLFEDADLQMAGYAAALRVLTAYTQIDGMDMTREALRPHSDGEDSVVNELIEFAVAIANEHLVPDGLEAKVWERLVGAERFYLRMLDLEAAGLRKLDNYQNFAKAFRVSDWQPLLASARPNNARLKSAKEFKRAEFGPTDFGSSTLRAALFAIFEIESEIETDEVMSHLRDNVKGYFQRRPDLIALADYLATRLAGIRSGEAAAARVLRDLVKGERLGA